MTEFNPARQAAAMIELSENLRRCNETVLGLVAEVGNTVMILAEHVLRILGLVRMTQAWKDGAAAEARALGAEFQVLSDRVDGVREKAAAAEEEASDVLRVAQSTRARWEQEHRRAAEAVAQAKKRVGTAENALLAAENELNAARIAVRTAERDLANAQNDKEPRPTFVEERRVQAARARVERGTYEVAQASRELSAARIKQQSAERRLTASESAVKVAERSAAAAERASTRASETKGEMSRVDGQHDDAKARLQDVEKALPNVGKLVDTMTWLGNELEKHLRESQLKERAVQNAADEVARQSTRASFELEEAADDLLRFDLPG